MRTTPNLGKTCRTIASSNCDFPALSVALGTKKKKKKKKRDSRQPAVANVAQNSINTTCVTGGRSSFKFSFWARIFHVCLHDGLSSSPQTDACKGPRNGRSSWPARFCKKKKKPLQTVYKYNSIWLNITIPASEPVIDLFIFLHFAILKFGSFGHS